MRHVLFVCGKNRRRSPTAEALFSGRPGIEVSSAGTSNDSDCQVSGDLIDWADDVMAMEAKHLRQLRKQFGLQLQGKQLITLDIPDRFGFMNSDLIELLNAKVLPRLRD